MYYFYIEINKKLMILGNQKAFIELLDKSVITSV